MGLFSSGASILGGLGSIAGGLFGGGGGDEASDGELAAQAAQYQQSLFAIDAYKKYQQLYNDYYWPIETELAKYGLESTKKSIPYMGRMRDYQLGRGDELIQLAQDTNASLDQNKKNLIQRLIEGEDVLADRYRSTASNDIAAAYAQQRNNLTNRMAQYGINPNSGSWANQFGTMARDEALAQAAGRTSATRQAEDDSLNRQMQALNLYTNPSMLYDNSVGTTPGVSVGTLLNGAGNASVSSSLMGRQMQANQNMWGGIGSGLGMLGGGLDSLFGRSGSGSGGVSGIVGKIAGGIGNMFS